MVGRDHGPPRVCHPGEQRGVSKADVIRVGYQVDDMRQCPADDEENADCRSPGVPPSLIPAGQDSGY